MKSQVSLLAISALLMTGLSTGWADSRANASGMSLGDLQTVEVHSFERENFSINRQALPPEILEYARTAIQNDERLQYASPGQGVLHFFCAGPECGQIRVELTYGEDGPVLWQTTESYRTFTARLMYTGDPDPRKFAKRVVAHLAQDYEKAMKAVPVKINIKE